MSVIQYDSFDDEAPPACPKYRFAFIGQSMSGKSHFATRTQRAYHDRYGEEALSVHLNMNDMVGCETKDIKTVRKFIHEKDETLLIPQFEAQLDKLNDYDLILIEDARYKSEVQLLKEKGFTLVYLKTPWYTRLKRLQEKGTMDDIRWFTDSCELDLETVPDDLFDYCVRHGEEDGVIEKILTI